MSPSKTAPIIHSSIAELPDLYVNDGKLDPKNVGILQPTYPEETSTADMRKRLSEDGYLLVKGLLPREDVLAAREQYFSSLEGTGILKPGTAPVDGIFDSSRNPTDYPGIGTGRKGTGTAASDDFMELAHKAHGETWYQELFCKHPALMDFIRELSGWGRNTWGLERTILRNNVPGNKAIGVHYDLIFLRHGNDSVLTAWVPMGDIKVDGGGLIYLEKGHILGESNENDFTLKAKASGMSDNEAKFAFNQNMMAGGHLTLNAKEFGETHGLKWLVTDYEAGDVIIHDSYMIHASTMNHDSEGIIRLGTDLRFVDSTQPWDTRWAKVYEDDDGL